MRRVLLAVLLAACGSGKSTGPAWPAPSTTAEDGGESLDPREGAQVAASIEKTEDATEDKKETPAAAPAETKSEPDKPAAAAEPSQPVSEDIIFSEEIIIEIDE